MEKIVANIRMEKEHRESLQRIAKQEGRTLSNLLQKMIRDFIAEKEQDVDSKREN